MTLGITMAEDLHSSKNLQDLRSTCLTATKKLIVSPSLEDFPTLAKCPLPGELLGHPQACRAKATFSSSISQVREQDPRNEKSSNMKTIPLISMCLEG